MTRRRNERGTRRWLQLPWREKRFLPLVWPAQAPSYDPDRERLVLPMGRGRPLIVQTGIRLETVGAMSVVWNNGYELHGEVPDPAPPARPEATGRVTIDLGEIHLGTAVSDTRKGLVVSGRGFRAKKRCRNKEVGRLARAQKRATTLCRMLRPGSLLHLAAIPPVPFLLGTDSSLLLRLFRLVSVLWLSRMSAFARGLASLSEVIGERRSDPLATVAVAGMRLLPSSSALYVVEG